MLEHDKIHEKYFSYSEDTYSYIPLPLDDVIPRLKEFFVSRENDDSYGMSYDKRVSQHDETELRIIFQYILNLKYDSGYKGRELPFEFMLNNTITNHMLSWAPNPPLDLNYMLEINDKVSKKNHDRYMESIMTYLQCLGTEVDKYSKMLYRAHTSNNKIEIYNDQDKSK